MSWDTYDLSVSNSPESDYFSDWFSFEALAWQPIRVEVEVSMPGSGVELRLFSPDDDGAPSAVATTDAQGRAGLSRLAHAGGLHFLHVRVANHDRGLAQTYRLSVAGPSSVAGMASTRRSHSEFADVPLWHPYRNAIQALAESRVLSGTIKGTQATFAPDLPVWIADFEHALAQLPAPHTRTHLLSDATPSLWHAQAPCARGQSDGNGDRTISRAAAIRAVVEALETSSPGALEQPPEDFDSAFDVVSPSAGDAAAGEDAAGEADPLRVAEYNGLLSGLSRFGARWDAARPVSRGEAAQLIHAAMHVVRRPGGTGGDAGTRFRGREPRLTDSRAEPAFTSHDDLATRFVPHAHEALDGLMEGLVLDDMPSDTVPIEIDGAAMRAVIANMRARLDTQNGNGATHGGENGDGADRDRAPGRSPS